MSVNMDLVSYASLRHSYEDYAVNIARSITLHTATVQAFDHIV